MSNDAGCSVARSAESFAYQDTECSVVGGAEGFGSQDINCSQVVGAAGFAFLVGFAYHHSSPLCTLPHSYKWGNVVPMSILSWASPWHGGLLQLGVAFLL